MDTGAEGAATPDSEAERRRRLEGHVALWVVQLCFGLFPLFGKWAFEDFAPQAVAGWRMTFGAAVLGTLAALACGRRALPRPRDLLLLQVGAILGVTLNQVLFLEGLSRSTAVDAGLIMCLIPVFTFALAAGARQERFSARRGLGLLLALGGCLVLLLGGGAALGAGHALGNLLMVLNCLSYSIYLVLTRPLARRYPPLAVIAWVYALSLWQVPLFAADVPWIPDGVSTRAWGSLAFILVAPTTLAYLLNTFALARVSASTTAVYIYVQPLIAGAAGVLLLGERLAPRTLVAALTIFAGIALVSLRPPAEPAAHPAAPTPRPGGADA